MSDEYKEKIRITLDHAVSKKTTYLKSGSDYVGVVANGGCGTYSTFNVTMDCEDSNNKSSINGWHGDFSCDGNVYLRFCLVDRSFFGFVKGTDYAVLDVSNSTLPFGVSEIIRYFDNEDSNNKNSLTVNGVVQPKGQWYGQSWFEYNTRLGLYYYPSSDFSGGSFPSLGISYGVFGKFGNNQGWIYSDDEDSGNANWCYLNRYIKYTGQYQYASTGNIPNIVDVGANTKLYLSKVN